MKDNRGDDSRIMDYKNEDRRTQHQNRSDVNLNGFEGMNYEQQRENYRIGKLPKSQKDPNDRNLRENGNHNQKRPSISAD
jgi:hypothetical protein